MRPFPADRPAGVVLGAALLAALLGAAPAAAQTPRDVVSKSVSVGRDAAALELEFDDGAPLAIALSDGSVRIGGEVVGSFESGDALDAAWRSLLGFAVALDDGPLARTLVDWSPPDELTGDGAELAARIDAALESAILAEVEAPTPPTPPEAPAAPGASDALALRSLVSLLDRSETLVGLAEALEDLDLDDVRLSIGDDLTVGAGEDVDATVLVVDGDLEVAGRIRGDAVVVDGDVRLAPGGRVDGDIRYIHGTLVDQGGRVDGAVIRVEPRDIEMERRLRDEIRDELRSEIRAAARASTRPDRGPSAIGRVFGGVGGALADLFSVLVLALIGAVVIHFAGSNLDAVAETARRTPGRALTVGAAGAFLILPAFVLGIVALAISIIGIPALILWVPLFPVAVVLAGGLGYLAVARNVGIWVSKQRFPYMGWVRVTNPVTLVGGGALALAAPFIAAEIVGVLPWTRALEVLLNVMGTMLSLVAILLGFGSVLLTRGGRRPEFFDDDLFGGWWTPGRRPSHSTPADDLADVDLDGVWTATPSGADAPPPHGDPLTPEDGGDAAAEEGSGDGSDTVAEAGPGDDGDTVGDAGPGDAGSSGPGHDEPTDETEGPEGERPHG